MRRALAILGIAAALVVATTATVALARTPTAPGPVAVQNGTMMDTGAMPMSGMGGMMQNGSMAMGAPAMSGMHNGQMPIATADMQAMHAQMHDAMPADLTAACDAAHAQMMGTTASTTGTSATPSVDHAAHHATT